MSNETNNGGNNNGRRVIKWILEVAQRYRRTSLAVVVMAALAFIVSSIPLLGCILLPIAQLVAVGVVAYVFIRERRRPSCRQMWCGRSPRSSATVSGPAYKK